MPNSIRPRPSYTIALSDLNAFHGTDTRMYTLVTAYGLTVSKDSQWGTADLSTLKMQEIFNLYRKLFLQLSSNLLAQDIVVDFEIFRTEYSASDLTLANMLQGLSNTALQTVPALPSYTAKRATFNDIFRAGYKVQATRPGSAPDTTSPAYEKTELRIQRTQTDMQKFHDYCLVTINGFFHQMETDGKYCYVPHGNRTAVTAKESQMGFVNFETIGKVKTVQITPAMVYKQNADSFLSKKAFIKQPVADANKTVLLVIGGYLYLPDGQTFFKTSTDDLGQSTYCVDFNHVPLLERYFESANYLDMGTLNLEQNIKFPNQIKLSDFLSDEKFIKYLTLPQSFFVIIDTPELTYERHYLRKNSFVGRYIAPTEPKSTLMTGLGKVSEYWKVYGDGQWVLNVGQAYDMEYVAHTVKPGDVSYMTDNTVPAHRYYISQAYMLDFVASVPN